MGMKAAHTKSKEKNLWRTVFTGEKIASLRRRLLISFLSDPGQLTDPLVNPRRVAGRGRANTAVDYLQLRDIGAPWPPILFDAEDYLVLAWAVTSMVKMFETLSIKEVICAVWTRSRHPVRDGGDVRDYHLGILFWIMILSDVAHGTRCISDCSDGSCDDQPSGQKQDTHPWKYCGYHPLLSNSSRHSIEQSVGLNASSAPRMASTSMTLTG